MLVASGCSGAAETVPAPATAPFIRIESSCDIILPGPFRFRAGSSVLDPQAVSDWLLEQYTSIIRTSCAKPERVALVGFLAPGEPDAPPGLAQARADAVLRALVARGVEASRLETHASAAPYPDETATEGRVEIRILRSEGRDWMRWNGQAVVPVDPHKSLPQLGRDGPG
jgi:outer membrane protein OmpA-like peptidoglycan-associated protein